MGKKKGKKGKAQDDGQSSSQEQSQPGSSRSLPQTSQPSHEVAKGSQKSEGQEQLPKQASVIRQQPSEQRAPRLGDGPETHESLNVGGRGRGRGQQTQKQVRVPGLPNPNQGRREQQEQVGPWKQGPPRPAAPVQQQHFGTQQPPQQAAPVQQQCWGPQQPPQQAAPVQQQRGGPQQPPQQAAQVQQPRGGAQQPLQQAASVQQQLGGPQQPHPQQAAPVQPQRWGTQQPLPHQAVPPPQQVLSSQERGPLREISQHVQQPQTPSETAEPQAQQQKGPKGSQKGKKQLPKQESQQKVAASGSQGSLTSQMSKMQISRPEVEAGGDTQMLPMQFIRAKPGVKCKKKILIETNHLSLNVGKLKSAVHYDVNLIPDTPKKYLREVLELFRKKHYSNRYPAFDGRKNLYAASMLPFKDYIEDDIILRELDGREKTYRVEIKFANNVDLTPLQDLLKSKETPREAMQVVDIVLRSAPVAVSIPAGRSFFVKPPTIIQLGEGMEMYHGFYQSAIRGWKPFLNVDVAHKAFPTSQPVLDVLPELFSTYRQTYGRQDMARPLNNFQRDSLNSFIKTLKISYEIPGQSSSRRAYSVNGLDMPPREKTFKLDTGEELTIERYFDRNKNYKLKFPNLPTLWVGSKQRENKILLPLELCTILGDQVVNRKMTENQTSNMIKHAATSTTIRKDKIISSMSRVKHNEHPTVREFGFSIGNEFEKIEARVLNPPALMYSGNRSIQPARGVWTGDKFFAGMTIKKWTIACVDRYGARVEDVAKFADMIQKCAVSSGMTIENPAEKPFEHIKSQTVHDIKKYFQAQKGKNFDVIFVIVPNSGPQYSYVKTAAEINVGCLTQCIKMRTLNKLTIQTVVNILLKVNSKLNGTNHYLHTRPLIMNKPCMIMGADVTHPSPEARDIPSVAAVTASHDPKAFQYNICWRLQPPKAEIIEDLEAILVEQLHYFYTKTNGRKPERIVFFRDGVSEGQFEKVRNAEIRAIRSACKKLQKEDFEPAITFLVVQKRHHTRLFPTNSRDSEDRNFNVPAGTCVDTVITHPFMQDFYLVSHASIQGVAKPTKYCTLWDENDMSNDDIEELAYYLCHMFTRCNRSVSYPAPTYYAHLAAARAKVYIENERLNMDKLQQEFSRFQILDVIRKGKPMFFV